MAGIWLAKRQQLAPPCAVELIFVVRCTSTLLCRLAVLYFIHLQDCGLLQGLLLYGLACSLRVHLALCVYAAAGAARACRRLSLEGLVYVYAVCHVCAVWVKGAGYAPLHVIVNTYIFPVCYCAATVASVQTLTHLIIYVPAADTAAVVRQGDSCCQWQRHTMQQLHCCANTSCMRKWAHGPMLHNQYSADGGPSFACLHAPVINRPKGSHAALALLALSLGASGAPDIAGGLDCWVLLLCALHALGVPLNKGCMLPARRIG
jgi:hypothetical protein